MHVPVPDGGDCHLHTEHRSLWLGTRQSEHIGVPSPKGRRRSAQLLRSCRRRQRRAKRNSAPATQGGELTAAQYMQRETDENRSVIILHSSKSSDASAWTRRDGQSSRRSGGEQKQEQVPQKSNEHIGGLLRGLLWRQRVSGGVVDQMFLALDHVDQCGSHDDQHALRVSTRCHQHTCISRTEERQRERAAAGSSLARPSRRLGHNKAQLKSVCV